MQVSRERLKSVDAELGELGKSEEEIAAVLARFEAGEPQDLEAVDAALAELVADREDLESILEGARAVVGSALEEEEIEAAAAPVVEAIPAEALELEEEAGEVLGVGDDELVTVEEEDLSTVSGSMEPIHAEDVEARRAMLADQDADSVDAELDRIADEEPVTAPADSVFPDPIPEPDSPLAIAMAAASAGEEVEPPPSEMDDDAAGVASPAPAAAAASAPPAADDRLSAEQLFGEDPFAAEPGTDAEADGTSDLSDLFYSNQLASMADDAEAGPDSAPPLSDVLEAAPAGDSSASPSEAPAALAALDELLDDEIELLDDDDLLIVEDDEPAPTTPGPPPSNTPPPSPSNVPPPPRVPDAPGLDAAGPAEATEAVHVEDPYAEGQALDEEEEAEEKGFFKKLFGSKKSSPPGE